MTYTPGLDIYPSLPQLPIDALPSGTPQGATRAHHARGFLGRLYSRVPDRAAECLVVTTPHPEDGTAAAAITWWSCIGSSAISLTFEEQENGTGAHTLDIIRSEFAAYQEGVATGSNPAPVEIGVHYMEASREGARVTNLLGTVSGQDHETGKVEELDIETAPFDDEHLAHASEEFPGVEFKTRRLVGSARESAIFVVTNIEKPDPESKKVVVLGRLAVKPQTNGDGSSRLYYSGKRWLFGKQRRHYRSVSRWPFGFRAEFPV